ncbi:hypothetical protein HETIRDRAFT_423239 [Heterobasidion irregulare TC 32-1]|uniref:Uncharacterized protein n=1 Tax=Heterobasidion irregulare (strain TC 32-1) TaxID=747525 RepID=W4JPT2_HETIT|nr:uncharacterized protein HETIRDRAFT_423239 [Heterobasidion irregulare TC 32-1]ETW75582.1 hypothetical protein HETIRDRAFT_423239 [Heterobasidion irregulare TC 32-1]
MPSDNRVICICGRRANAALIHLLVAKICRKTHRLGLVGEKMDRHSPCITRTRDTVWNRWQ